MNSVANYREFIKELPENVKLVAVSKTKSAGQILNLYEQGQRDFGENYVQELIAKQEILPKDIHWHFIGHLQTNKVKQIAPFISLIHGADSFKILVEINKQAAKNNRVIDCLLQIHIAREETKFGFDEKELMEMLNDEKLFSLKNICIRGVMGMASNTASKEQVRSEFSVLKGIFDKLHSRKGTNIRPGIISMGMSSDYKIAIAEGSNMIRIGSLLFGDRNYN